MSIENRIKKSIPDIITRFPSIQVLYLFGSHATGSARTESDVDIAVFTDGSEAPTMDLELGLYLQKRIGRSIDVVIMQKASPILRYEVLRHKIRIYERDPAIRAIREAIAFHDFMDARYYQKKRFSGRTPNGQYSPRTASPQ